MRSVENRPVLKLIRGGGSVEPKLPYVETPLAQCIRHMNERGKLEERARTQEDLKDILKMNELRRLREPKANARAYMEGVAFTDSKEDDPDPFAS